MLRKLELLDPRQLSILGSAGMFEAHGHKQGYLVEAVGTPPERFAHGAWRVVRQDDGWGPWRCEVLPLAGVGPGVR